MARHHVRDNEGNLHFFNDEEYKQYRYRNGCLGVIALLVFLIGGLLGKCNNDKDTSSSPKEETVKSEVQNPKEESDNTTDMNLLMNEQSQMEESEEIEAQGSIEDIEDNSTIQEKAHEENGFDEVDNDESYSTNNNDTYSEDPKLLKKQLKEERKLQKKLEKEAKRKAKEEAKEAKRKAREDGE